MKKPAVLILLLLAVLGVAAWFVLQRPGESSIGVGEGAALADLDSAAVDRIVIRSAGGTVVLEKQSGAWMLTDPLRAPADPGAVGAAVGKSTAPILGSVVSTNPAKQEVFQVDTSGTLVRLFVQGAEKAAFRVGKAGAQWTETYVRREGSDDVYLAQDQLSSVYARAVREWRDKSIFTARPEAVRTVRFLYGDTTFALTRSDSAWLLDGTAVAPAGMHPFLTAITSLQTDDFVDTALAAPPPLAAVIVVDGTELRFHRDADAPSYLVRTSASPQWYTLQQWRADQVLKRRAAFAAGG
jgi:hypothetical protein